MKQSRVAWNKDCKKLDSESKSFDVHYIDKVMLSENVRNVEFCQTIKY